MQLDNTPDGFATDVISLQDTFTARWHVEPAAALEQDDTLWQLVVKQHRFNFDLWHEEDKAREPGAPDATIAKVKRAIDKLNQQRNDAITEIDECLETALFSALEAAAELPWNSETIGSIVDRLSIASLKVFHMREQAERDDASAEHVKSCEQKVARLTQQQQDLGSALQEFIADILAGRKQNKMYRQFKMYNDPNLNPKIYSKRSS